MIKDDIINEVVCKMQKNLTIEQSENLKSVLITVLYPLKVETDCTEIALHENDNEKYFMKFKNSMITEEKSESTISQYLRATNKFFNFIQKNFRDVTCDDVLLYFAHIKINTNNSSSTRDNERKFVKSFFNWLCDNEEIQRNPFRKMKTIKRDEKQKVILSEIEVEKIRDSCKNDIRDLAIIDFLLSTGLRVSEICYLNIDNVNFNTNEVSVYGKKTNSWRNVYLDAKALKHLYEYINDRTDNNKALFVTNSKNHKRLSKNSYERIIKKYSKMCNINKKCTVHIFRKTLASKLYRRGLGMAEIAKILGHTVAVLQKYYLTIDDFSLKNSFMQTTV